MDFAKDFYISEMKISKAKDGSSRPVLYFIDIRFH